MSDSTATLPPMCAYCGLQTPTPADHMWQRHKITSTDHERNLSKVAQTAKLEADYQPGGYL